MTIKPALSSEEWAAFDQDYEGKPASEVLADCEAVVFLEVYFGLSVNKHGGAAALLHRQPYGFTWDDVDILGEWIAQRHADALLNDRDASYKDVAREMGIPQMFNLAERIASLLPPRENTGPDEGKP